jgi:hypothetical protein
MFLVVIRSDLRNPLFLSDIEPVSQTNPPTESPRGQARYVSRPNAANIQRYLDAQALNDLLALSAWTIGTGWSGAYNIFTHTSGTTALSSNFAAVALQAYSLIVTITGRTAGTVTATFGGGTTGAISATTTTVITASTTGNLVVTPTTDFDGTISISLKVSAAASAAALITATVPGYAGGLSVPTVDISATKIKSVTGLIGATDAQVVHLQSMLGYHIVETDTVKKSVLAGCIHGYLSPEFNPDSRGDLNHPPATKGQAVQVVQDVNAASTSTTLFVVKNPIITGLTLSGTLTIAGSSGGLAGYGLYEPTVIIIGNGGRQITQAQILAAGGTISDTSIVVPATLIAATATIPTVPVTGKTWVRVQVNDMLSNKYAL